MDLLTRRTTTVGTISARGWLVVLVLLIGGVVACSDDDPRNQTDGTQAPSASTARPASTEADPTDGNTPESASSSYVTAFCDAVESYADDPFDVEAATRFSETGEAVRMQNLTADEAARVAQCQADAVEAGEAAQEDAGFSD